VSFLSYLISLEKNSSLIFSSLEFFLQKLKQKSRYEKAKTSTTLEVFAFLKVSSKTEN